MQQVITFVTSFLKRYERWVMPIILIGGFIIDNLTFTQIDRFFEHTILSLYIVISAAMLYVLYGPQPTHKHRFRINLDTFAPFILQYCIGGLFSALFIFYFRSGSVFTSLPFLLILFGLMIGNEYVYRKFPKASFQLSIFFIALLSYCNLLVPLIIKQIGALSFGVATIIASLIMYAYIALLDKPKSLLHGKHRTQVHIQLASVLTIFVFLYITNVIPPIPLSMKTGVIAYNISRNTSGEYNAIVEKTPWYAPFQTHGMTYSNSISLYAFSAIYAPIDIAIPIVHEWSRYDENSGWKTYARAPIAIIGGRQEGFRGFSFIQQPEPGNWRVDVMTERGQVIGRIFFSVSERKQKDTVLQTY